MKTVSSATEGSPSPTSRHEGRLWETSESLRQCLMIRLFFVLPKYAEKLQSPQERIAHQSNEAEAAHGDVGRKAELGPSGLDNLAHLSQSPADIHFFLDPSQRTYPVGNG